MALEELGINTASMSLSPQVVQQFMFWAGIIFVFVCMIGLIFFMLYIGKHNIIIEVWQLVGNRFIEIKRMKARKIKIGWASEYRLLFKPAADAIKPEDSTKMIYKEGKNDKLIFFKRNDQEYDNIDFDDVESKFKPIPQSALLWGMTKFKEIQEKFKTNQLMSILQVAIPVVMMGIFLIAIILILRHMEGFESSIMNQASQVLAQAKQSTIPAVKP